MEQMGDTHILYPLSRKKEIVCGLFEGEDKAKMEEFIEQKLSLLEYEKDKHLFLSDLYKEIIGVVLDSTRKVKPRYTSLPIKTKEELDAFAERILNTKGWWK